MIAIIAVLGAAVIATRPPAKWHSVTLGMTRSNVYSLLGAPAGIVEHKGDHMSLVSEGAKDTASWHKNAIIGRWEFYVVFRFNDTVGTFGERRTWNWW